MKKTGRKLVLNRETLRALAATDLGQVAGGDTFYCNAPGRPRSTAWTGDVKRYCD